MIPSQNCLTSAINANGFNVPPCPPAPLQTSIKPSTPASAAFFAGTFFLTDWIDGFLARKLNVVSEFGKKLDAVSDKLFALCLMLPTIIAKNYFMILKLKRKISVLNSSINKIKVTNHTIYFFYMILNIWLIW